MSVYGGQASAVRPRNQLAPPGQVRQRSSPSPSPARTPPATGTLSAFDPYAPQATPSTQSFARSRRRPAPNFFDDDPGSDPGWGSDDSAHSQRSTGSESKKRAAKVGTRNADPLAGLADVLDDWDQVARRTQTKLESWFGLPPADPSGGSPLPSATPSTSRYNDSSEQEGDGQVQVLVHQVQPGDTLAALAVRYGAPLATLRRANGLWDRDVALARPTVYIPLNACTRPTHHGAAQTTISSSSSGTGTSDHQARSKPRPSFASAPDPSPNSSSRSSLARTPVSAYQEQQGRAALPSPLLEARLAPHPAPHPMGSKRGYAPRSSDAFLIDLSDGGSSATPTPGSGNDPPTTTSSSSSQATTRPGDAVAAIPARELGYFPPPLHPTPLYAGTKSRSTDKARDQDPSRDSLDSLSRMSAARSASVQQPPAHLGSLNTKPTGPLSPSHGSIPPANRPLAPGFKPLQLASSVTTKRPGPNLMVDTSTPQPGVKVNHAYTGSGSSSHPDSGPWSSLLAGLPPNSGAGAKWARPISLPDERGNATQHSRQGGQAGGSGGAQSWSANDWSTLLGDTIRGRVTLDTAFQTAADKVGKEFRDWTLDPPVASKVSNAPRINPVTRPATRPTPRSVPQPPPVRQPPATRPAQPSQVSSPAPATTQRAPASAGSGDLPLNGLTARRKGASPAEERIELL